MSNESDLSVETAGTTETTEPKGGAHDEIAWTMLDHDELVDAYWDVVAPAMRTDELDPDTERPTHSWLSAHGFRGLIYALREYHDRTFGEFWSDDLELEAVDEGYEWGINHEPTIELLEAYLESRRDRGNLSESSGDTLRYRLAKYVRAYRDTNGTSDLVAPVARESDIPAYEATDAAWTAIDHRRIHEAVNDWYAHLVRRKRAAVNPVAGLEDEYRWSRRLDEADESPSNPALAPEHVQALHATAETPAEQLLVVALCAWGLRSSEVAALHRSQLVLDVAEDEVPYVSFVERKNGPGEVSILYGRETATDRLIEFGERDGWNGYLFPSNRSASGHMTRQTLLNRFDDLADRAGLPAEIDGQKPIPQMGRRFWYDAYSATQEAILEEIGEIAAEQGSASADVVLQDYLSEDRRRQLRREYMHERLSDAFEYGGV
jgi:integrase